MLGAHPKPTVGVLTWKQPGPISQIPAGGVLGLWSVPGGEFSSPACPGTTEKMNDPALICLYLMRSDGCWKPLGCSSP